MKALVLAAGEGKRLKPITLERPKPMVPIAGRPLLEHTLYLLRQHGFEEIAINLHYRPKSIIDYFKDGKHLGLKITYSYEEKLLGSAGAVKRLEDYWDGPFLVIYGDLLTNIDLSGLARFHTVSGSMVTMALYSVDDPETRGVVEIDETGRVRRFIEKPGKEKVFSNLVNAGIYVVEKNILEYIPGDRFFDFGSDLFPSLLAQGIPISGCPTEDYVLDIGTPDRYAKACSDFSSVFNLPSDRHESGAQGLILSKV